MFKINGASSWAITRAEKLQVSVFLPNELSMDDWYAGVYALPTVWPDVSMRGINNLRRVVGYDFHHMRKKYDVPSMWGNVRPRWRLLQQHLEATGPGWYSLAETEERLFTDRSNQPGDDMKDELRTDNDVYTVNLTPRCITNCAVLPNAHLSTMGGSCLAHKLVVKLAVVPNDDGRKQGVEVCIRSNGANKGASSSLPRSFDVASSTKAPKNRTPWFHIPRQTQLVHIDHNAVCWYRCIGPSNKGNCLPRCKADCATNCYIWTSKWFKNWTLKMGAL